MDTACPAHSLLCRVDFTRFENDSGAEQYVLAETEAFRIKSLALAPDSTSEASDSSSDGVEDDCAINVAQVQATWWAAARACIVFSCVKLSPFWTVVLDVLRAVGDSTPESE